MLQVKQMTNVLFSLPSIAQYAHRFRIVGNLINVIHDYQSIQVGPSSLKVSTLVLPFSSLDGIKLGFLRQQSCNQGETIC